MLLQMLRAVNGTLRPFPAPHKFGSYGSEPDVAGSSQQQGLTLKRVRQASWREDWRCKLKSLGGAGLIYCFAAN